MKKLFIVFFAIILVLSIEIVACAASLTGTWTCDDGGTYYLTQIDNAIYWYGENDQKNPGFANVGVGKIVGNYIYIEAADVPKGKNLARSTLVLYKVNEDQFYTITKEGWFGGSTWYRN